MRLYLLDTSLVTALLFARARVVTLITPWMLRDEAVTSVLVYGEVIEYIASRSDFVARRHDLKSLLQDIRPLPLNYGIMERYADLRRQLRPPYGPGLIGDLDTLIAATAFEHNLTVVSTDRDFQRVPGLNAMLVPRIP